MADFKKSTFKLLSDEPTCRDAFGSHEKVSHAISDLIKNEDKGRSIALIGDWGSGKSSVVEMLKIIVENDNDNIANLFLFDVWAHKGDSIRRAFLEKLIEYFSPLKDFPTEKWNEIKEILAKRYEETEIDSYAEPTKWAIRLTVSVFCVPLGLAFITQWQFIPTLLKIAGAFLAGLPLFVLFFAYLDYLKANEKEKKKIKSIFIEKGEEKRHTKTFRTPEPTSIEFQQYFSDLLGDGLNQFDKKIIIVIDNMDRVGAAYAKTIWAAMRTFFETENCEIENRLWLLVPISEDGIKQIWGDDNDLTNHFESKTFQTRFNISPSVLKDWKEFFIRKLHEAFPAFNDPDEFYLVYRIYRSEVYSSAGYPTPRDIITFINRIGAIFLQRGDEISLNMIALYVALITRNKMEEDTLVNKSESLLMPTTKNLVDPNYPRKLAALHYNVPEDKALNVLLGPKIENAIIDKKQDVLIELQTQYGFVEVFVDILDNNISIWVKDDVKIIAFLAKNIKGIDPSDISSKNIWARLCQQAEQAMAWPGFDETTGEGLALLINYKKNADFTEHIIKAISISGPPKDKDEAIPTSEVIEEWTLGITSALLATIDLNMSSIISESFICPGDAPTYLAILKTLVKDSGCKLLAKHFRPKASDKAITAVITEDISNGEFDEIYYDVLHVMNEINPRGPWKELAQVIANRIEEIDTVKLYELEYLLPALLDLYNWDNEAVISIRQIAQNGYLFHHLPSFHKEKSANLIALSILIMIENNPELQIGMDSGQIPVGLQLYRNLLKKPADFEYVIGAYADLLIKRNKVNSILAKIKSGPEYKNFINAVIRAICLRDDITKYIDVDDVIDKESKFYTALQKDEYQAFIEMYVINTDLLIKIKTSEFDFESASLYLACYIAGGNKDKTYIDFMISGLSDISEDDWIGEIGEDYDNLYDLLSQLSIDKVKIDLGIPFKIALNHYKDLKIKGQSDSKIDSKWQYLLASLNEDFRITFITDVADEIIEKSESYKDVIDLFGENLLNCDALQKIADDIVRKAFPNFYANDRLRELEWLADILRLCPKVLKESTRGFKKTLKGSVENEINKADLKSDKGQILSKIATILNVDIPRSESDENENNPQSGEDK